MSTIHVMQHPVFSEFGMQSHRLQNRLVVAPMSRVSATLKGVPTQLMSDYYEAFAQGGFSMIITEGIYTDQLASQGYPQQPGIVTPDQVQAWRQVVKQVKQHPSLFICQLMHAGALSQHLIRTLAPSAIQPLGKKMPEYGGGEGAFPLPAEMTHEDIEQAKAGFIKAAQSAYSAGFDGVEIHGANGYLLDQFLTDYTNQRTDAYGGSIENRFRLVAQIITGIRKVVPPDFLIGLRLSEGKVNNLRYRWPEGPKTAIQVLTEVVKIEPSYVHIAAESGNWERDCLYSDGSSFTGLAKAIVKCPVIANGGLHNLSMTARVLDEGHADLIALGKAALADPQWPNRTKQGEATTSFMVAMIKPSATIEHTQRVIAASAEQAFGQALPI